MIKAQLLNQLHGREPPAYADGYKAGIDQAFDDIKAVNPFNSETADYDHFKAGVDDALFDS